jgi:hypothetical protein
LAFRPVPPSEGKREQNLGQLTFRWPLRIYFKSIQGDLGRKVNTVRGDSIGKCAKTFQKDMRFILNGYETKLFEFKNAKLFLMEIKKSKSVKGNFILISILC